MANPLDKSGDKLVKQIEKSQKDQADAEERNRQNTLERIARETKAAREKATRNPVDHTTTTYEEMLRIIKERNDGGKDPGY